jgi:ubiquinone/menaquinone biosynthesis C-methylase UbiE
VQQRILEAEILDHVDDQQAATNLDDIARINRLTGATRRLIQLLEQQFSPSDSFTFLDIGAASGDLAKAVIRNFPNARITCLDLKHRNLKLAPHARVQADAFLLPFAESVFDVVHCSLFLHHFTETQTEDLIANMHRVARRVVLIQDLHRHWISYYFLPWTQWLLGWNWITVEDGQKSVAAGWKRSELKAILESLDLLPRSSLSWHFPSFRYFIAIEKNC